MGQTGNERRMFFRMQHRKGMVAKGEDRSVAGDMGLFPSQDHPTMAEMEAIKKTERQMSDGFCLRGGTKRIGDGHVRRMREISGREMRWRAR